MKLKAYNDFIVLRGDIKQKVIYYFLLIKPQFEVGKGNTKKGIVKDINLVDKILSEYKNLSEDLGLKNVEIYPCHIKGGDGNQEYFLVSNL